MMGHLFYSKRGNRVYLFAGKYVILDNVVVGQLIHLTDHDPWGLLTLPKHIRSILLKENTNES